MSITQQQALEALDSMDDYARMAGVIALGPMNVLRQYIWQSQEPKAEDAPGLKKVWVISYNGVLQPTMYYTEDEAAREVKRRQDEYPHDKSPRTVVPLWTAPTQAHKTEDADLDAPESNTRLISALAACRDVFPIPEHGSSLERAWAEAMADPMNVPEFGRAAMAQERKA